MDENIDHEITRLDQDLTRFAGDLTELKKENVRILSIINKLGTAVEDMRLLIRGQNPGLNISSGKQIKLERCLQEVISDSASPS